MRNSMWKINLIVTMLTLFCSYICFADEAPTASCVKESSEKNKTFDSLATQFAGDTTLVAAEIFKGYTAFSNKKSGSWIWAYPKAIGIRATAATPADTSSQKDYADASLLLKDGALVGLTFSFMASPFWPHWYTPCHWEDVDEDQLPKWGREFSTDRYYLTAHPVTGELGKFYFLHGLTFKAIKNGLLDDDDNNSSSDIDGAGTLYVGLGADGPIGIFRQGVDPGSIAGTIDFHLGWKKTWLNKKSLQSLYMDESIDDDSFEAAFATLKIQVTEKFSLDIEHISPHSNREYMDNVTSFKLGYTID